MEDRSEMKSSHDHHYLFLSSAGDYRSSSCDVCKLGAEQPCASRFLLRIFFFSLIIPSEVDGCLLCDTWEIIWQ